MGEEANVGTGSKECVNERVNGPAQVGGGREIHLQADI